MTVTPGSISRRIGTDWVHEGSYILSVPTVPDLPPAPETDDVFAFDHATATLYYSKAGAWLPFSSGGGGGDLGRSSELYSVGLTGTMPAGSAGFTVGTISIPAKPYERYIYSSGYVLVPVASATALQFIIVGATDTQRFARSYGGAAANTETVFSNCVELLPANTAATVTYQLAHHSGTSAAATLVADSRFNRGDVLCIPVQAGPAVGDVATYTDYTKATAIQSWASGMDPASSTVAASVVNGRWAHFHGQLVAANPFTTGSYNATLCTLIPALRPAAAAIYQGNALLYPSYQSTVRVNMLESGALAIITTMPASQTQVWVNFGYPLYIP